MASLINIIMPLVELVDNIKDLIEKYGIHVYLERRDKALQRTHILLQGGGKQEIAAGYSRLFFSAMEVPLNENTSFYADGIFDYCIEVEGGRETDDDIELIKLRVIGKNPDKTIKSFFTAVNNRLKKDGNMGVGVFSGDSSYYKNIFYQQSLVGKKTMWFDFKRKNYPIRVEA